MALEHRHQLEIHIGNPATIQQFLNQAAIHDLPKHLMEEAVQVLTERIKLKDLNEQDVEELTPQDATIFRAIVARGNYMSIDRSDIRFAVKELARRMAKPRNNDY